MREEVDLDFAVDEAIVQAEILLDDENYREPCLLGIETEHVKDLQNLGRKERKKRLELMKDKYWESLR